MIPFLLAAVGGYLIGDSMKNQSFADGGMAKGGKPKVIHTQFEEEEFEYAEGGMMADGMVKKGEKYIINLDGKNENEEVTIISDFKAGHSKTEFITLQRKVGANYYITLSRFQKSIVKKLEIGGMMAKDECQRCHNNTYGITTMSMFNEDIICMICKEEEKKHPDYEKAVNSDIEEIKKGNYNFKGIGLAKGGMVVTSIKDIPNFKQRLDEGKITYRGLGLGKLFDDFYDIAGEQGVRIKVDGKEYFITDTEFNTFSRGSDGKMRIRFEAPYRKGQ